MITPNNDIAEMADTIITISDGKLVNKVYEKKNIVIKSYIKKCIDKKNIDTFFAIR